MSVLEPHLRFQEPAIEKFAPADRLTVTVATGQEVNGSRLVALDTGADRTVREAGAGSLRVIGVSLYKVGATDTERKLGVACEGVWLLRAAGAIQAGDRVEAAAGGTVRVAATVDAAGSFDPRAIVGTAIADIADGADGPVRLSL